MGLGLDEIFYLRPCEVLYHTLNPDEGLDLGVQTIRHKFEFTIWGYKSDEAFSLKLVQAHALVELDVFHLDKLTTRCSPCHIKQYLIVKAQLQLGHAGKHTTHFHGAENL